MLYLALNKLHYDIALNHRKSELKFVFFDSSRVTVPKKKSRNVISIRLSVVGCLIFLLLSIFFRAYIPHLNIGLLSSFVKKRPLYLIDDGLDYFRSQPKCLSTEEISKIRKIITFEEKSFRPAWLPKQVFVEHLFLDNYNVASSKVCFENEFLVIESVGLHDNHIVSYAKSQIPKLKTHTNIKKRQLGFSVACELIDIDIEEISANDCRFLFGETLAIFEIIRRNRGKKNKYIIVLSVDTKLIPEAIRRLFPKENIQFIITDLKSNKLSVVSNDNEN